MTGLIHYQTNNTTSAENRTPVSPQAPMPVIPYGAAGLTPGGGSTATRWSYAAAGSGIANTTTAVTIKTAAGAGIINYITAIQLTAEALGTATEVAIRDGAGGTVLWRIKVGTGGITTGLSVTFQTPLAGSANTLLEVVTITASTTGAVYFNAQGYSQ